MHKTKLMLGLKIASGALAVIVLAGCAGIRTYTPVISTATDQQPAALPEFGYPMDILRAVSADSERFCCGGEFAAVLPNQRVTAQGTQLQLEPSWDADGEPGQDDLAFAMYVFNLDGYDDQPELAMRWDTAPADWGCCFVGLGNQLHNRWDWFTGDELAGCLLILEDLAPYLSGDGDLVMTVLMTGTDSCTLSWLRWGGNVAPVAALEADPSSGTAPLAVSFNASASLDPDGTLIDFEWDLDGDAVFNEAGTEADARGSVQASYNYDQVRAYTATVRVTDNDDATATAWQNISVYEPGWVIVDLTDHDGVSSLAVIAGCPAICFGGDIYDFTSVYYTKSDTATGTEASDWCEPVLIADAAGSGALVEVGGHPSIKFLLSEPPRLMYTRSTTAEGTAAADWSQKVITTFGSFDGKLAVVDGHPAFALGAGHSLYYMRATTPTGANSADWGDPTEIYAGG